MPLIDMSNPLNVLVAVILYVLALFLSKEIKRSAPICITLLCFLTITATHCIEYVITNNTANLTAQILLNCITVDFIFTFLSFIGYLWIDDIEAKAMKIESIDNSLEWFWKKV